MAVGWSSRAPKRLGAEPLGVDTDRGENRGRAVARGIAGIVAPRLRLGRADQTIDQRRIDEEIVGLHAHDRLGRELLQRANESFGWVAGLAGEDRHVERNQMEDRAVVVGVADQDDDAIDSCRVGHAANDPAENRLPADRTAQLAQRRCRTRGCLDDSQRSEHPAAPFDQSLSGCARPRAARPPVPGRIHELESSTFRADWSRGTAWKAPAVNASNDSGVIAAASANDSDSRSSARTNRSDRYARRDDRRAVAPRRRARSAPRQTCGRVLPACCQPTRQPADAARTTQPRHPRRIAAPSRVRARPSPRRHSSSRCAARRT